LYDNRKQIVLTADCAPGEIKNLEERLVSRFKWGLVASIDSPSYETRIAIVKKKAAIRGLDITEDVAEYIAAKVVSNIRELEGALTKVYATAKILNEPITLEIAKTALGESPEFQSKQINIAEIIDSIVKYYNIRRADLQSKKRNQSIAMPRQICMYIARNLTSLSLEEIGGHLGGRDHTTVMHACSKINDAIQNDDRLKSQIDEITKTLQK
jgi:chromosomal replication initiator protein